MKDSRVEELIVKLYEMIEDAPRIFGGSYRDKVLDLLDEIKGDIPSEIQMAKEIVNKRDAILAAAQKEADKTRTLAQEYARQLVNENEISAEARRRAAETLEKAEKNAREIRRAAAVYCDDTMRRAEQALSQINKELGTAREQFNKVAEESNQ